VILHVLLSLQTPATADFFFHFAKINGYLIRLEINSALK
jgi:hypothetical protein